MSRLRGDSAAFDRTICIDTQGHKSMIGFQVAIEAIVVTTHCFGPLPASQRLVLCMSSRGSPILLVVGLQIIKADSVYAQQICDVPKPSTSDHPCA